MNLNDKALLVQLSIRQWSAFKRDKRVSKEVAEQHGAVRDAGNYNKKLFPAEEKLSRIHAKSMFIRQEFYRNTLPWGLDGTFILPTANYLNFMTEFRRHRAEWEWLVSDFVASYDDLRELSERLLGDLYDPADYPDKRALEAKFSMDLAVFPVPSTDFRVTIASEELTRIQQDVEERVKQAEMIAMRDVWQRLYERVQHIAEKLADPRAIFRDSMLESARETCELLTRLNFADDPELEQMRQRVEQQLIGHHPDALRNDPDLRQEKAKQANDILEAMRGFIGGV